MKNNRESSRSRERRFFSKAAATLVLGAGALTACTNVVEGAPVPGPMKSTVEVSPIIQAPETHLFDINDVLQGTETAPRSPKNDTARCVFAASQAAIIKFMHDPAAKIEHRDATRDIYTNPIDSAGSYYSVIVDTATPGSATISFDATLSDKFSLRGELTIPTSGAVDESLTAVNPVKLNEDYHIAKRSGVFNLQTGEGEVIDKSYTDGIAEVNCQAAAGFIASLKP